MNDTTQKPDRTWDVLCHLSALAMFIGVPFGNVIGPLIVWLVKKDRMPSVDAHGKEALNFQISVTIYLIAGAALAFGLALTCIGIALAIPLIIVLAVIPVVDLVFMIIAAIKASNGEFYRYPLTLRFIS